RAQPFGEEEADAACQLGRLERLCDVVGCAEPQAELASRIRLLLTERLRTRHRSLATPIERGGFSFVPLTRRLSLGDEVIHLPPAEARLFHVLLLHEGEMLTRDHLTLKACGREWSPGDRTVDVLIARLRRRLPLETAEIVTIHRSGYLLSVHDV
ncbi:MAG: winged helix-turn-helix domain-containing protein, partial [Pseudomonadota bacterium]